MTATPRPPGLLPPEMPFAAIHGAFVTAGWDGGPVTRTAPLVADEPEVARYQRGDVVVTYSLDPVMFLRTVTGDAPPSELPDLPWLGGADVLSWLATDGDEEPARERRLLGVVAAAELGLRESLPALRRIAASDDPLLAAAARHAGTRLATPTRSR